MSACFCTLGLHAYNVFCAIFERFFYPGAADDMCNNSVVVKRRGVHVFLFNRQARFFIFKSAHV